MKTARKAKTAQSIASGMLHARRHAALQERLARLSPKASNHQFPTWARLFLGVVGLSGILLMFAHLSSGAKPGKPITDNESTATKPSPSNAEPAGVSLGLRKGDRLVYEFQQARLINIQAVSLGGAAGGEATQEAVTTQLAQSGDLILNVYDETRKGWWVGCSVERPALKLVVGEKATPADELAAGLRAEILVFVGKTGRIGEMSAPANTPPQTLSLWRDILSRWQTVLSPTPSARIWNSTEEDATGTYIAAYSRESAQPRAVVRKQKQQYLAVNGASQQGFEARFKLSGSARIELAPYPTNIEGHEKLTLLTPEIGGSVNSQADYSFHLVGASQGSGVESLGPELARQLESRGASFGWAPTNTPGSRARKVDVSRTTIEEQMAALEQLLADGKSGTPAEVKILQKIATLVKNDDQVVEAIVNRLSNPQVMEKAELSSALIGMLGAAGTAKAQETLIGIAHTKEWPLPQRQMALFSFAQVTDPTPAVDGWLQQMHQEGGDLANNSLLILGAMGDQVRAKDPERFNQISDYVIRAASTPGLAVNERIVGLDAIGNLGPQEVPQAVHDALAAEDELLRERAVESLQRIDVEVTYPMLRHALQNDPIESVRAAAANLLGDTRRTGGYEDLSSAVIADSSAQVRIAAARSLGQWLYSNPGAASVLQQVATQDSSPDVRDAAARILQSRRNFEVAAAAVPPGR